ncbi:major head protein [Agrobacterium phage Atu_ph07]|uniref:Major capsid protein n=1 Tax=Agrobacterium phage Atu_ph07 TaxID=2024264 RepID=A0A2L0UZP5_9CAUD|nr:major head protein [Agrobacterium phage Atu_ph07]AUZ94997.1 major capsid protein [Agrobacterium phage Atu_ph07]
MSKLFESNWDTAKAALLEGKDLTRNFDGSYNDNKKRVMNAVLENVRKDIAARSAPLMENATAGATSSGNVAVLNQVILPIIRRVMPTIIANEIVGVQPISGPVAQISTLRVRYADSVGGVNGVTAGAEALSPFDIARYYSGNENPANPGAATTSVLEGRPGNRLNVELVRQTVEAKTRRLSSRWTFEAAQDMQSQYGVDLEAEVMNAVATEITTEIDQEILGVLRALPGTPAAVYDQANVSGTATFVGDEFAALAILINRQSNLIASRTKRGPANWAVVSNTALTILQAATTSAFARTTVGTFEAPTNVKYAGMLNNSLRVYVDTYASDSTPVLVGYKGQGETDAAAYFCPYVPLTSTGVVIDPQTLEPLLGFMSRNAILTFTNSASSFGNSADYLGLIGIDASTLKFL